jgi:SWI/SNF related-matrix-associated actin-dependent regulator of chromatin subfamily C
MVSWYISKENINNKNIHEDENESDNDMGVSISIDEKSLKNEFCLICEDCYNNKEIPLPKNLKRENFEISSIYNLFSKEKLNMKLKEKIKEQNWTEEENKKLLESMKNNNNWDDIVKSLGKNNNKTKTDCILHLIQMPIIELNDDESDKEEKEINDTEKDQDKEKDNENIKEGNNVLITENEFLQINQEEENKDNNNNNIEIEKENIVNNNNINLIKIDEEKKEEEKNDRMNNKMLEIFMRLFKRYLNEKDKDNKKEKINDENGNIINKYFKEVIYKTFAKSIDKCKELKNDEKIEMKNIVDILVYLEMKKIELKMNYFRQFERLLEYKKTLLKTIETQIIQERIKLITKKLLLQQKQHQANETK